jgi:hypothetical protein
MLNRIFKTANYVALLLTGIYFSLCVSVLQKFGYQYARLFPDPKDMGMNVHYLLARYAFVVNLTVLLPFCLIAMAVLKVKKQILADTALLCLLNIFICYFFAINPVGPMEWLAD